jgi:hypothetical protein
MNLTRVAVTAGLACVAAGLLLDGRAAASTGAGDGDEADDGLPEFASGA